MRSPTSPAASPLRRLAAAPGLSRRGPPEGPAGGTTAAAGARWFEAHGGDRPHATGAPAVAATVSLTFGSFACSSRSSSPSARSSPRPPSPRSTSTRPARPSSNRSRASARRLSAQILGERQKAPFKDWNDLTTRVKGVGDASAAQVLAERPHRQRHGVHRPDRGRRGQVPRGDAGHRPRRRRRMPPPCRRRSSAG